MRILKYFLEDVVKHKARVYQLYFIGEFLQGVNKNRIFVNSGNRYADYFPEYSSCFGRSLILLKSMYGITNSGKLFYDEFIEWLLEAGSVQLNVRCIYIISMHQMEKYTVVLSYINHCVYSYICM